jgi:hypothetical protein
VRATCPHQAALVPVQIGSFAIMLSLLFCGFMMNTSAVPAIAARFHWLSYFAQAYELLVVNEFHDNPTQFVFTAPVDSLPSLRVTGEFVLKQFGYRLSHYYLDYATLTATAGACLLGTYLCLLLSHPDWSNVASATLMGTHPHSRRRMLFRWLLAITLGDAALELYDPLDFPALGDPTTEAPDRETPRTPPTSVSSASAAALARAPLSQDLGHLLCLETSSSSSSEAGSPLSVVPEYADEERTATEVPAAPGSVVELSHSHCSSVATPPHGDAGDAQLHASGGSRGHARHMSLETWRSAGHNRQRSVASEPCADTTSSCRQSNVGSSVPATPLPSCMALAGGPFPEAGGPLMMATTHSRTSTACTTTPLASRAGSPSTKPMVHSATQLPHGAVQSALPDGMQAMPVEPQLRGSTVRRKVPHNMVAKGDVSLGRGVTSQGRSTSHRHHGHHAAPRCMELAWHSLSVSVVSYNGVPSNHVNTFDDHSLNRVLGLLSLAVQPVEVTCLHAQVTLLLAVRAGSDLMSFLVLQHSMVFKYPNGCFFLSAIPVPLPRGHAFAA